MKLIESRNVCKDYFNQRVVTPVIKDVSLTIQTGEFCGIVGPSGSGKSTLLYLLSGLETPSAGSCYLFDKCLFDLDDDEISLLRKKEIGFVFQFYNLIPNLTVFENVSLPMIIAKNHDSKRIDEVLRLVGMIEFKDRYPNQLSGGMQQKVAIARAIVNHPKIIFADEPTGNLDQKSGKEIMTILKSLNQEQGITVVLVTHNIEHMVYCTRKIELRDGMIANDEPVQI